MSSSNMAKKIGFNDMRELEQILKNDSWACISLPPEEGLAAARSFSVGFQRARLPELLLFGMPPGHAHQILQELRKIMLSRQSADQDTLGYVFLESVGLSVFLHEVPAREARDYMTPESSFSADVTRVVQVVVPDRNGVFQWQEQFGADKELYPLLAPIPSLH